jgi:hypothetical protein
MQSVNHCHPLQPQPSNSPPKPKSNGISLFLRNAPSPNAIEICSPHSNPISSSSLSSPPPSSSSLSLLVISLLLPNLLSPSRTPKIKPLPSATSIAPTPVILDTPPPSPSSPFTEPRILLIRTSLKSLNSPLTLSGSGTSSLAASNKISPSSSQW